VVFQNYSLLPWLTVYDNVHLAVARVFPKMSGAQQREHTLNAIAKVNLSHAILKKPSELSGGMRRRVSVARALAIDPRVLLLDEPLSALDALTRANIQDEFVRIWEADKKTVVLITNDVDEGILLADRIIPLKQGPGATLGPSIAVDLPRPRSREGMNHDPAYRRIRSTVIDWLLGPGRKASRPVSKPTQPITTAKPAHKLTPLTIGFVPLTDAAPFIVAKEKDLFRKHGLDVTLKRMTSWAQVTDALSDGTIDAAHLLYGIPIAVTLGMLGAKKKPMVIPWIASRNGQAITLAKKFDGKVGADPAALKPFVDAANAKDESLTFAMTFPHGTHAMWLRYWLAAGGIHPDVYVTLTTVTPPNMVA
jgi:ABC-type nitrate/sulfonate/bicarbonate transport system ATPase subunit